MGLISTHVDRSERLEHGRRIFTDTIHMKPIASYRNGSLRRDHGVLSATGAADWPLGVDGICDVRVNPRIAGKSPLLHMGHGKDFVRFSLVGANNVSGVSKGNVTTFPNAWNNADLRYTYGGHRVQEDILLRTGHPRSFTFILQEHTGFDPVNMTVGDIRILQPVLEPPAGSDKLSVPLQWLVAQQGGKWQLTVTLPQGDYAGWTVDPTLTLQPGPDDGIDGETRHDDPNNVTLGTQVTNTVQQTTSHHNIVQLFSLAAIPAASTITAASLTMTNNTAIGGNYSLYVHRILAANAGWTEDCSWNYADGAAASDRWAGDVGNNGGLDAGCDVAGTDYASAAMGNISIPNGTPAKTANVITLDAAQMQTVLANNYGFQLHMHEWAMMIFCSSDNATASYHPKLVVEYTLPAGLRIFPSAFVSPFAPPFA